jgi:hypothetical protein
MFRHLKPAAVPSITLTLMCGIAFLLRLSMVLEHMR